MDVDVHLFTCYCLIRLILSCDIHPTFTAQCLGYDIYIYIYFVLCFCICTYFFLQEIGGNKCIHKKFFLACVSISYSPDLLL